MIKRRIFLKRQDLKFSAAHFTIFDDQESEKLHGHNYFVYVIMEWGQDFQPQNGLLVDFDRLKRQLKQFLSEFDEKVLIPAHTDVVVSSNENSLIVNFRERSYCFPKNEVRVLPIRNISVEELSQYLGRELLSVWSDTHLDALIVGVEETPGQGAEWHWSRP